MALKKSSVSRRNTDAELNWKIHFLVTGECEDAGCIRQFIYAHPCNPEHSALWGAHGEEIMKVFIRDNPGRRPYYWWHQHIKSGGEPRIMLPREAAYHVVSKFGIPCVRHDFREDRSEISIESEANYLQRHNLLTEEEIKKLQEKDYHAVKGDAAELVRV